MQQYNKQFERHLKLLLEDILLDVSKKPEGKEYLQSLFRKRDKLEPQTEIEPFERDYFLARANDGITPFTGVSEEAKKERRDFIQYLHRFIQNISPEESTRRQFLLPVQDEKNKDLFRWNNTATRNLYLMAQHIAKDFEKARIAELITKREEHDKKYKLSGQAERDRKLNQKGLVILVKNANGPQSSKNPETFNEYRRADELKPDDSLVLFWTPPSTEARQAMSLGLTNPEGYAPTELIQSRTSGVAQSMTPLDAIPDETVVVSTIDFKARREENTKEQMKDQLAAAGLELSGDVALVNGQFFGVVESGGEEIQITVQNDTPANEELTYIFTFGEGPLQKKFTLTADQIPQYFQNADGTKRTIPEVYAALSKEKDFHPDQPPKAVQSAGTPTENAFQNTQNPSGVLPENQATATSQPPSSEPLKPLPFEAPSEKDGEKSSEINQKTAQGFAAPSPFAFDLKKGVLPSFGSKTSAPKPFDVQGAKAKVAAQKAVNAPGPKSQKAKDSTQAPSRANPPQPLKSTPNFLKKSPIKKLTFREKVKKRLPIILVGASTAAAFTVPFGAARLMSFF